MGAAIVVSGLLSYPVKSCAAVAHRRAELGPRGLPWDRAWMVVDEAGRFLTQRAAPALATVRPAMHADHLALAGPHGRRVAVPLERARNERRVVTVWRDACEAWDEGDEAAALLEGVLGRPARLVRMADDHIRPVAGFRGARTGFADAYPMLVMTEASLADLNRRLAERGAPAVPMDRFRPNLVLAGGEAYAEDAWRSLATPTATVDLAKPCARCVITTVDQERGEPTGPEPLATLAAYRLGEEGALFGRNAVHREPGRLEVGQPVTVA